MNNSKKESLATRLLQKKPSIDHSGEQESNLEAADFEREEYSDDETEKAAVSRKPDKTSPKKDEKEKFYTYMSSDNYEEFEEMFIYVRKAIAKKTGKKLKVTNMAELAIVLAKKQLFDKDKKEFLALIEEELKLD